jgi:hypothetical protein
VRAGKLLWDPDAASGKVFSATFTMQIEDGKLTRTWRTAADLQRLFQLGVRILPPEPPRPSTPCTCPAS